MIVTASFLSLCLLVGNVFHGPLPYRPGRHNEVCWGTEGLAQITGILDSPLTFNSFHRLDKNALYILYFPTKCYLYVILINPVIERFGDEVFL